MKKILLAAVVICSLFAGCTAGANDIGEKSAREIALKEISGATESDIREFRRDYDDGKTFYEGKIVIGNTEYEFEIDASNGNVVKWEKDSLHD